MFFIVKNHWESYFTDNPRNLPKNSVTVLPSMKQKLMFMQLQGTTHMSLVQQYPETI
jgi:hypothetical protein